MNHKEFLATGFPYSLIRLQSENIVFENFSPPYTCLKFRLQELSHFVVSIYPLHQPYHFLLFHLAGKLL
jgi:hypothetical protein